MGQGAHHAAGQGAGSFRAGLVPAALRPSRSEPYLVAGQGAHFGRGQSSTGVEGPLGRNALLAVGGA